MGVTKHWNRIVRWLAEHAPATGSVLRSRPDRVGLRELTEQTGLDLPADLREWWNLCDGTDRLAFAEILPPFYTPYGPAAALRSWQVKRRMWAETWIESDAGPSAGSPAYGFHPAWLPIAFDGCGDALVVDLRPGPAHGCVLEWDRMLCKVLTFEWPSVPAMLDDVATALETHSRVRHCDPTITIEGRLDWRCG
ncbi:SMI1/KNR4 family protein [Solihabitans fulvus]|uniref:SMI1/KNR4 family protein n=1 Tax=Solihabitans fulvus TaxID=1892852 RepID=UPI001661B891|nr:SMI1/KNR4 family protein [Solihabitans fulvus]